MQKTILNEIINRGLSERSIVSIQTRRFVNKPIASQGYKGVRVITPNHDTRNNPRHNTGLRIGGLPNDNNVSTSSVNATPVREHGIHTLKSVVNVVDAEERYKELSKFLPDAGHPEYYIRRNWINHLLTHKLTVAPDFVAQLGQTVHLIDVRMEHELTGPVGYIPGTNWFPRTDIQKMIEAFPDDAIIAVVCMNDSDSRDVVRQLNAAGKRYAAIMAGGMRSWKLMGFSTSRDPSILNRRCVRVSHGTSERMPCSINKRGRRQLTLNMISEHIGDGGFIQWIKMAAFMVHGRLSCVDGRDDCGVIGTPGGDMGEFVIALSVAEELLNRQLTEEEIASLFQRRLDAFGRFYMHTDQACLDKLMSAIYADPYLKTRIRPVDSHFAAHTVSNIPVDCRDRVIDLLLHPDYIGCGHLRLLMQKSDSYKVRRELVTTALKCFFYAHWDRATECDYVVLSGLHEECAVASVSLENEVHSFTRIPLIPPTIQGNQMFVAHEQISTYLRNQQAEWFLGQHDIIDFTRTAAVAYSSMLNLRADLHTNLTLSALATDLPLYSLRFAETGVCEVTYNGIINSPEFGIEVEETNLRLKTSPAHDSDQPHDEAFYNRSQISHGHLGQLGHYHNGHGCDTIPRRAHQVNEEALDKPQHSGVGKVQTVHIDIPHNQHHFGHSHAYPEPSTQHHKMAFKLSEFWSGMKTRVKDKVADVKEAKEAREAAKDALEEQANASSAPTPIPQAKAEKSSSQQQ